MTGVTTMHIAILGAGNVGGTLGRGWGQRGHQVTYGVRDPAADDVRAVVEASGPGARAALPSAAVRDAAVVVFATPWEATLPLAASLDLAGKVVIDATNPLAPGLGGLVVSGGSSGGEELQRVLPGARVVKCFNTTGAGNFVDARYPGGPLTMLYAGDDAEAKAAVAGLGTALGLAMVDAGPLVRSRLLEQAALLWITLAYAGGMGPGIAFRLERRG